MILFFPIFLYEKGKPDSETPTSTTREQRGSEFELQRKQSKPRDNNIDSYGLNSEITDRRMKLQLKE